MSLIKGNIKLLCVAIFVFLAAAPVIEAVDYNFSGYDPANAYSYRPKNPTGMGYKDTNIMLVSNASQIYDFDPTTMSQLFIFEGQGMTETITDVAYISSNTKGYASVVFVTSTGRLALMKYATNSETYSTLIGRNPNVDDYGQGTIDTSLTNVFNVWTDGSTIYVTAWDGVQTVTVFRYRNQGTGWLKDSLFTHVQPGAGWISRGGFEDNNHIFLVTSKNGCAPCGVADYYNYSFTSTSSSGTFIAMTNISGAGVTSRDTKLAILTTNKKIIFNNGTAGVDTISQYSLRYRNGTKVITGLAAGTVLDGLIVNQMLYYIHDTKYISDYLIGESEITGAQATSTDMTGTYSWVDEYGSSITQTTEGVKLRARITISPNNASQNPWDFYDLYAAYGSSATSSPEKMLEKLTLPNNSLSTTVTYAIASDAYKGATIYGTILARNKSDGTWSRVADAKGLTISALTAGVDTIVLDKFIYNTSETITATATYSDTSWTTMYQVYVCNRPDCAMTYYKSNTYFGFEVPRNWTIVSSQFQTGYYYAVLVKRLPFGSDQHVAYDTFYVGPPNTGVFWEKQNYNIPRTNTTCRDATKTSDFVEIPFYAGFDRAYMSCSGIPADAEANNSVMKVSFYSKLAAAINLTSASGTIFNITNFSGNATLIYVLTPYSSLGPWTLSVDEGNNDTSAFTTVNGPQTQTSARLWFSGCDGSASCSFYVGETLTINAIGEAAYSVPDNTIVLEDAAGQQLLRKSFPPASSTSAQYFIDPAARVTYGTWTARLYYYKHPTNPLDNVIDPNRLELVSIAARVKVYNTSRPVETAAPTAPQSGSEGADALSTALLTFMGYPAFWGFLLFCFVVLGAANEKSTAPHIGFVAFIAANIEAVIGLWDPFALYILVVIWVAAGIFFTLGRMPAGSEG